jgi:hypothetical protein
MRFRNTFLLVIVFIIVAGYVYLTEGRGRKAAETALQSPSLVTSVLQLDPGQVLTITVQGPTGQTRLSRQGKDSPWQMETTVPLTPTLSGAAEADEERANLALSLVANLTASRVLTDVTDLAPYGLASPQWAVTLETAQGQRETVYVGDKNPQGWSYYVKRAGDAAVYLIAASTGDDLRALVERPPLKPTPTPTATATREETPSPTPLPTATASP